MLEIYKKKLVRKYVNKLGEHKVLCKLCPNNCTIPDGKSGLCRTRMNIGEKLYSTVYGYPCSINLDPIEKKPLYHFFPGQKILSIGTFGCNLFCRGCQNFDITRHDTTLGMAGLKYYAPEDIVDLALRNNVKMIAYTYNEPTIFFEYMIDIARVAKKHGIKNVIVSNGYINPEPLKELCKYIDAANIDLKGMTDTFYKKYCGVKLEPVLETIKYIHSKDVWLELTNLLVTRFNDDKEDVENLCDWIMKNLGGDVPLHFSRFYPYYHAKEIPSTPEKSLDMAKDIAIRKGIKYVYIGNLGFLDNTHCHKCGSILIERDYGQSSVKGLDKKNLCIKCGAQLPGIF
jgi:pyruvate formate lyase activating enzyme